MPIPPREIYAGAGDVFVSHHITASADLVNAGFAKRRTQMLCAIQIARSRYSSVPYFW